MKYSIDTIPVWDAFRSADFCPLCTLYTHLEEHCVEFYLGDSVMEPDNRVQVNEHGFCREHFQMLFDSRIQKLSLALLLHTHMTQMEENMSGLLKDILTSAAQGNLLDRTKNASKLADGLNKAAQRISSSADDCLICKRINEYMERYIQTIFYLWDSDADFQKVYRERNGFCMNHFALLLGALPKRVLLKNGTALITATVEAQRKGFQKDKDDIYWFTQKFDHKNADKPWGDSRDALPRALNRLHRRGPSSDGS